MSDLLPAIPERAILPVTGEVIDLNDAAACARALADVRAFENDFRQVKALLSDALVALSQREGTKTLHTAGGKVTVKGGSETTYDGEMLEVELRQAGMSEERIREIVVETVTYSVRASEAKRAAAANPAYAAAVERARTTRPKAPSVSVGR